MTRTRPGGRHRLVTVALAVALLAAACGDGDSGGGDAGAAIDAEAAADELSRYRFETIDGAEATLADFAGTPLVLNFFASWCGPCRAEMPDLEAASRAAEGDVTFFGLLVRDSVEAGQAMIDETGVTYGWGIDSDDVLIDFDGIGMPTTVFISATGEAVESHVGPLDGEQLRGKLSEHFGVEAA